MGNGIAQVFATAGFSVTLVDIAKPMLDRARMSIEKSLVKFVEKGKMTLPMIHFLRTAPAEHRQLLRSLMSSNDPDKPERIRNLILPSGSMAYAVAKAREYADRAKASLAVLPDSEAAYVERARKER